MRDNMTLSEELLWERLRNRKLNGLKFRRQHAVGRFVLDFYCAELKLCIEVDGGIHKLSPERDTERSQVLAQHGIQVLRITNSDVNHHLDSVLQKITATATTLAPPELGDGGPPQ